MLKRPLFLLVLFAFAGAARAEEPLRWRAAILAGRASEKPAAGVDNPGVKIAGAEIGRAFMNFLEFGYSFSYAGIVQKQELTASRTGYDVTFHLLFADFLADTTARGFYAGPELGIVNRSLRKVGQNVSLNALALGARAGYNYPLSARFSLGLQGQYLIVGDAKDTVTENNVNTTFRARNTGYAKGLLLLSCKF